MAHSTGSTRFVSLWLRGVGSPPETEELSTRSRRPAEFRFTRLWPEFWRTRAGTRVECRDVRPLDIDSARSGSVFDDCTAGTSELMVKDEGGGQAAEQGEDPSAESLARVRAPWRLRVRRSLQVQEIDSIRWRIGAR